MDLSAIPALDQHAHNLLRPDAANRIPYSAAFTEGQGPDIVERHARWTLFYRRSLRDVAELLGCEATEDVILECRDRLGLNQLASLCFRAANLEGVFLDDGFLPDAILPVDNHDQWVLTRRLLRIEVLAASLLRTTDQFHEFLDRFRAALESPPANVVGFKSIAAYRSGLAFRPVSRESAEAAFDALREAARLGPVRLSDKALIDYLIPHVLELAARKRLPVQFHTGFGDTDLDLRLANPLHLRPLLEDRRYREAPIVLLHASYPFAREAGYLASVYPQVYADFGLAIPFLSVAGMRNVLHALLELTPMTKLMYSSDAHYIPELFYLAAKWGRRALGEVLEQAIADSDLSAREAEQAATLILRENARELYRQNNG